MLGKMALLGLSLVFMISTSTKAQEPQRTFDSAALLQLTHWTIEHDKEDGSGNNICILTASWPGKPISFSVRKDATKDHFALRIYDPTASFTYAVPAPISVIFDGDLESHDWNGPASGVGSVFDFRLPIGPAFATFESQLLAARSVTVISGHHLWTADLVDLPKAYAVFQNCIVSVEAGDHRW